jgi:hypothetical protein
MSSEAKPALSIYSLFADRDALRRREKEQEEQLKQRQQEELTVFRKRLETFEVTDENRQNAIERIKRAFERGETELMLTSFPSSFCVDDGRAVINAGAPPINKPNPKEQLLAPAEPAWVATMPAGVRKVYDFWKQELEPGGFKFSARIVDYPGGMPGNVGLFLSWPKSALDQAD